MNDYNSAPKDIDKLFKFFPYPDRFNLEDIIEASDLSPAEKLLAKENYAIEKMLITDFGYVEYSDKSNSYLKLTPLGIEVKNAGGHFSYIKQIADKKTLDKERQERKDKSDKLDLKIKDWQVKTKWFPYAVSLIALIVSIGSYFKPEKKPSDLQLMQQQIQELQEHVNRQDALFRADSLLKKHK